jgi:hypothetical protein
MYLRWLCRSLQGIKLGEDSQLGLVHAGFALLSPRAGVAVSKEGGKGAALIKKD